MRGWRRLLHWISMSNDQIRLSPSIRCFALATLDKNRRNLLRILPIFIPVLFVLLFVIIISSKTVLKIAVRCNVSKVKRNKQKKQIDEKQ